MPKPKEPIKECIAVHGWGFDADCWQPLRKVLDNQAEVQTWDRGYFGNAKRPLFQHEESNKLLLLHSFGLHLVPEELLYDANLIAIFGGFLQFHPSIPQFRKRSRFILQRMMEELQSHPEHVLTKFRRNCFKPEPFEDRTYDQIDVDLLIADLDRLNNDTFDIERLKMGAKICILHGSADNIIPKRKGRELFQKLGQQANYLEVKSAGHGLPFTRPEECWKFIRPEFA